MKKYRPVYFALLLSFILGIRDGNIALWKEGCAEPVKVFPYKAGMLPPQARSALEAGITIESTAELEALAENYLS